MAAQPVMQCVLAGHQRRVAESVTNTQGDSKEPVGTIRILDHTGAVVYTHDFTQAERDRIAAYKYLEKKHEGGWTTITGTRIIVVKGRALHRYFGDGSCWYMTHSELAWCLARGIPVARCATIVGENDLREMREPPAVEH